jgi:hypothetical protein
MVWWLLIKHRDNFTLHPFLILVDKSTALKDHLPYSVRTQLSREIRDCDNVLPSLGHGGSQWVLID